MDIFAKEPVPAEYCQALFRWKHGHQVFHILLTAMNTLVETSLAALQANDYLSLVRSLRYLCMLYDASSVSMMYTADFPRELYESFIRPSMMPPSLSPGFSGTLNTEHEVMTDGFKQLSRSLNQVLGSTREQWPSEIAEVWGELRQAQARSRKHHGLICHKFVDNGVSLLREFYTRKRLLGSR